MFYEGPIAELLESHLHSVVQEEYSTEGSPLHEPAYAGLVKPQTKAKDVSSKAKPAGAQRPKKTPRHDDEGKAEAADKPMAKKARKAKAKTTETTGEGKKAKVIPETAVAALSADESDADVSEDSRDDNLE